MDPSNSIKSGFSATGIFPFNPDILPVEAFAPSSVTENPIEQPAENRDGAPIPGPVEQPTPHRENTPSPGPSNMANATICNPSRKTVRCQLETSSDSDDSESDKFEISDSSSEEETNDISESDDENNISFTDMLNTPEMAQKLNKRCQKPAINSRAQVVTRDLFNNPTCKAKTSKAPSSNKNAPKKKIPEQKQMESWYCKACQEDRIADMRLCVVCKSYLHDDCLGLTKEDKIDKFICPYCS